MGAFLIFAPRSALYHICGSSSAGRASPCQGEGRGFESRLPLLNHPYADGFFFDTPCPGGGTGRHAGLKILFAEKASAGSIPAPGTKNPQLIVIQYFVGLFLSSGETSGYSNYEI
jgi:hypothetical protein